MSSTAYVSSCKAEKRTLAEVRLLFDACVDKYLVMSDYLTSTSAIVHSPTFENATVKIQNDLPLTATEQSAIQALVVSPPAATSASSQGDDFATTVLH